MKQSSWAALTSLAILVTWALVAQGTKLQLGQITVPTGNCILISFNGIPGCANLGAGLSLSGPIPPGTPTLNVTLNPSVTFNFATDSLLVPIQTVPNPAISLTLTHPPIMNTLNVYRNGLHLSINNGDYSVAGLNVVYTLASTGDFLEARYNY